MRALADLAARFPDDLNALRMTSRRSTTRGRSPRPTRSRRAIKKLDPDAEVDLDRALARHDWKGAIAELQRSRSVGPTARRSPAASPRCSRARGTRARRSQQLAKALAKDPKDEAARFRLADARSPRATRGRCASRSADALAAGAKGSDLREAIDLLEGATYLEPWRLDGKRVIRDFVAWERRLRRTAHHMDGTAARVLDYSALWVHPDGSSDMLEHEILRIQSQEEIGRESEQQPPSGLVFAAARYQAGRDASSSRSRSKASRP